MVPPSSVPTSDWSPAMTPFSHSSLAQGSVTVAPDSPLARHWFNEKSSSGAGALAQSENLRVRARLLERAHLHLVSGHCVKSWAWWCVPVYMVLGSWDAGRFLGAVETAWERQLSHVGLWPTHSCCVRTHEHVSLSSPSLFLLLFLHPLSHTPSNR